MIGLTTFKVCDCLSRLIAYDFRNFMHWIAPSAKNGAKDTLENRLWESADRFRANSGLKSQEYAAPVLGLILLRLTEVRFAAQRAKLETASAKGGNGHSPRRDSRIDDPTAYHADGMLYLRPVDELTRDRSAMSLEAVNRKK